MNTDPEIRVYSVGDDWEIWVGKTATANDRLSLKIGHPNDFWFHVAGMPGSHVVARHPSRPVQCTREVKRLAAGYAAFFSKARTAGKVAVHWTTCKNVGKRRGAPAGQVVLKKYDVIKTEPIEPPAMEETQS
ncbi:MAG: DUF814 domain-containing protein [Acidobacteria bacterium]|nr:DUF814 domain-containing protein [Acidobacteriota bacterium]